jgi:hypothetical protein
LNTGVDTVAGDSRVAKNLTINIAELGNDMKIVTDTINQSPEQVKQILLDAILTAVNDVNGA